MLSSLFGSLTTKLAAAGVAVLMTGTGALAATGSLPDTVQTTLADAAEVVGIDLPTGDDQVTDIDDDTDGTTDDTDGTTDDTDGTTDDGTDGTTDDGTEGTEGTSGKSSSDAVHAAIDATEPGPGRGKAVSEAARQKPAGEVPEADDTDDAVVSGNANSAAVHGAIESTEPGPGRGKAVSQAASQKAHTGDDADSDDAGGGTN